MNIIKSLLVPFLTLITVANAQAPTSQNLQILEAPKIVYTEEVVPISNGVLTSEMSVYTSISSEIRLYPLWDAKLIEAIFTCESGLRQFYPSGEPVSSHTNDYGVAQINEKYWHEDAVKMGLDYKYSMEDNIALAYHVYKQQSYGAWVCYNSGGYLKYL